MHLSNSIDIAVGNPDRITRTGAATLSIAARVRTTALAGVILTAAALWTPVRAGVVHGDSMEPTLEQGQFFLFTPGGVRDGDLRRGDVVLVPIAGKTSIKRVFALPGERFWYVTCGDDAKNSARVVHESEGISRWKKRFHTLRYLSETVPAGCVFVLGDSSRSLDSRGVGPIPVSSVLGRTMLPAASPEQVCSRAMAWPIVPGAPTPPAQLASHAGAPGSPVSAHSPVPSEDLQDSPLTLSSGERLQDSRSPNRSGSPQTAASTVTPASPGFRSHKASLALRPASPGCAPNRGLHALRVREEGRAGRILCWTSALSQRTPARSASSTRET